MMNNATDLIAKLLATEDLTVVHDSVGTASFNIKTRVLTLPIWKDASNDLIGMLVGHEVGHALFTTEDYYTHALSESPVFQGYLNVLEDVRIEKLMKRKYPGLRKTFMLGYKELNDSDFFDVKNADFNDMLLIDKINLYFKVGYNCGATFDAFEKTYVDRAERTETIAEVIKLAEDIWEYTKQQMQKQQQMTATARAVAVADGDIENGEEAGEDQRDGGGSNDDSSPATATSIGGSKGGYGSPDEDAMASKTEKTYSQNIKDMADTSVVYRYWKPGKFLYDPIVSHKEIAAHLNRKISRARSNGENVDLTPAEKEILSRYKTDSVPVVNYLYKEFEMKKAATAYKRTTISKTGQLDMRKIYSYKLKDDIFKRMSTIQNGKNHGMIMLVDWSGSMSECLGSTMDQVINLAYFCRKAQIPFQVLAFSDTFKNKEYEELRNSNKRHNQPQDLMDVSFSNVSLLELFSNKMSSTEFNTMVNHFKTYGSHFLRLGGTPLNESLNYMIDYIGEFQKKNNVEKMTFITLSDGEGHSIDSVGHMRDSDNMGRDYKHFLRDENSKKVYHIERRDSSAMTLAMLNIIKDRYDVTTLGFYLTNATWNELRHAVYNNVPNIKNQSELDRKAAEVKTQIKSDGYASVKGTGRDDLFIVPMASTRVQNQDLSKIDGTGSAAAISNQFSKIMSKSKTSRLLLSRFIDYIA